MEQDRCCDTKQIPAELAFPCVVDLVSGCLSETMHIAGMVDLGQIDLHEVSPLFSSDLWESPFCFPALFFVFELLWQHAPFVSSSSLASPFVMNGRFQWPVTHTELRRIPLRRLDDEMKRCSGATRRTSIHFTSTWIAHASWSWQWRLDLRMVWPS